MTLPSQNTWNAAEQSTARPQLVSTTDTSPPSSTTKGTTAPALAASANDVPPRRGLSIGVKATLLAAVFGILPVSMVGSVTYWSANKSITERIAQEEIAEADQISDQLRRFLQERSANINTVANIALGLNIFDPNLTLGEQSRAKVTLTEQLTRFVQDYRAYANLTIFDLQGNVLVQSLGSAREQNQIDSAYFQQVLQTKTTVISEPVAVQSGAVGSLTIYMAAPIVDDAGVLQGVVAAKIPVDFIGNAVLQTANLGESTTYRLVDSEGAIFQRLPRDSSDSQLGLPMTELLSRFADASAQEQNQAWVEPVQGREMLNGYAPLNGFDQLNWSVVISTDTSLAFLPQRQLLQTIMLGTLATGVTAVLLAVLLAKRATRPVEQVARTVELLGQGQLDARVSVRGNDELAMLGYNVNRMGSQIQELLATLRKNAEQLGLQNDVLAQLAQSDALLQGDTQAAAVAFTAAIAQTLHLDRVSVWLHRPEQARLICLTQYQRSLAGHCIAAPLSTDAVPEYFAAIADGQTLAITDVTDDWISRELAAQETLGSDTTSLLEVPIRLAGNFVGSLRCEHGGSSRKWQGDEQTFVNSITNLLSLALESELLQGEVSHLLDVVSEVEDGNLTTQAQVSDRTTGLVADTFNRLIERLAEVLRQVIDTAQQVSAGANYQKSQANLIAANAEQQADGVNQILQLTAQVEALAQNTARQVDVTMASLQAVQTTVEQGQQAMANLTTDIGILQEGSDRIVQQMKTLGEFVGLADQFVQDQTQIAYLTQTLALNASLVAARATEQRDPRQFVVAAREFSSIANQVSQLAQQTNDSLTTLEQRSAQIQNVVFTVDTDVQRLGGLVEGFTQGVEQSTRVFRDVQTVTTSAVQAETAVAQASQEIVEAVQTATAVVRTITDIAAQTAELTQNNRMQSEQMEALSQQLLATVVFFQLPHASNPVPPAQLPESTISTEDTVIVAPQAIPSRSSTADPA